MIQNGMTQKLHLRIGMKMTGVNCIDASFNDLSAKFTGLNSLGAGEFKQFHLTYVRAQCQIILYFMGHQIF